MPGGVSVQLVAASSKYKLLFSKRWQRVWPISILPLPLLSTQLLSLLLLHLTHLHPHTERDGDREVEGKRDSNKEKERESRREKLECCMTQRHNWQLAAIMASQCVLCVALAVGLRACRCIFAVETGKCAEARYQHWRNGDGVNSGTKAFC